MAVPVRLNATVTNVEAPAGLVMLNRTAPTGVPSPADTERTTAVNETDWPYLPGLRLLVTLVAVGRPMTACDIDPTLAAKTPVGS